MDDMLYSADTLASLVELKQQMSELLELGKLKLA